MSSDVIHTSFCYHQIRMCTAADTLVFRQNPHNEHFLIGNGPNLGDEPFGENWFPLHYVELHWTTLHYGTLRYNTLRWTRLFYMLQCMLSCSTLSNIPLRQCMHYSTLRKAALSLHYTSVTLH